MQELNFLQSLGQVSSSEAGEVFRDFLRGSVRSMICDVMAGEVTQLCGPKHSPTGGDKYRAGSTSGRVLIDGDREEVTRPRVRQRIADGVSHEVHLESYTAASDPQQLQEQVVQALMSGVSTRQMSAVKPKSPSVSRSSVSRLWQEAGSRLVDELRRRDLSRITWCAILADGIRLSDDQVAVAAIGIDSEGNKHVLDFSLGSSENLETARELLTRITKRGFKCEHRLYVILDGSDALRAAAKEQFPDCVVQRCLVHKERNIKGKLQKSRWGELSRLFGRLRKVQGYEAACEVVKELKTFLKPINAEAYRSLKEASEDLLALHQLNVPNTLHRSLLSTNAIENSYLNTRRRIGRVTRFRAETDQASRWFAYAFLEAEKGFRKIHGHKDLHHLISALRREPDSAPELSLAGPLPSPTAPAPAKPPVGST